MEIANVTPSRRDDVIPGVYLVDIELVQSVLDNTAILLHDLHVGKGEGLLSFFSS